MTSRAVDVEALLTPGEVATLFRVDPKTVTRWATVSPKSAASWAGPASPPIRIRPADLRHRD